jgi:hypothetical protein
MCHKEKNIKLPQGTNVFEILFGHNFSICVLIKVFSTTKL